MEHTKMLCASCFKPVDYITEDVVWTSRCNLSRDNPLFVPCSDYVNANDDHSDCIDNPLLSMPLHSDCYDKGNY
jgi:hypothetical protein